MALESKQKGWVVISENHPTTGSSYTVPSTFSQHRQDAINAFVCGSGSPWRYWQRKFNFKCVKAEAIIKTV